MEGNTLINCRQPCGDPDCLDSCVYTRKGNTLMDRDIQHCVLRMLRAGISVEDVRKQLLDTMNELKAMEVYLNAIKESDMRP